MGKDVAASRDIERFQVELRPVRRVPRWAVVDSRNGEAVLNGEDQALVVRVAAILNDDDRPPI